jgi:hypothetical protein
MVEQTGTLSPYPRRYGEPYLNVTLGVRSCIFLSFESVKTAKKLWREGNTTAEFFYTNPGLKQRGEPKAYKASSPSTSAPLVPPGAREPGYTSATVFLCMRKNLASDKLFNTQNFLHLKSK